MVFALDAKLIVERFDFVLQLSLGLEQREADDGVLQGAFSRRGV